MITDLPFINKVHSFGYHPSCVTEKHLTSDRQLESLKINKHNMNLQNAFLKDDEKGQLTRDITKALNNHTVIIYIFKITFHLVEKHSTDTHN